MIEGTAVVRMDEDLPAPKIEFLVCGRIKEVVKEYFNTGFGFVEIAEDDPELLKLTIIPAERAEL